MSGDPMGHSAKIWIFGRRPAKASPTEATFSDPAEKRMLPTSPAPSREARRPEVVGTVALAMLRWMPYTGRHETVTDRGAHNRLGAAAGGLALLPCALRHDPRGLCLALEATRFSPRRCVAFGRDGPRHAGSYASHFPAR